MISVGLRFTEIANSFPRLGPLVARGAAAGPRRVLELLMGRKMKRKSMFVIVYGLVVEHMTRPTLSAISRPQNASGRPFLA